MMGSHANVATRSCDYGEGETSKGKSVPETNNPLHIEQPSVETIPRVPKGSAKCATINLNIRAAQNYTIVEDLAQSPCVMSALEVLQSCPTQRSALLSATENLGVGMYSSLMGTFNLPPPTAGMDTISSSRDPLRREFVQTPYSSDPGTLASSVTTLDDEKAGGT